MNLPPALKALIAAQLFSLLGEAVMRFALPLYVLNLTGSASVYGAVVAAAFVPYVLLTPLGGVLADRLCRQRIMAVLDALLALTALVYLALVGVANLVVLTTATLMVLYAVQSMYQPTVQSSVPLLVSGASLTTGISVVSQVSTLTGIVGPVLGGLVFGLFGIVPILVTSAAAYVASCLIIVTLVRIPHAGMPPSKHGPVATACADLAEALRFLRSRPLLTRTLVLVALANLGVSAFIIVGAPFVVTVELGLSNQLMGLAEAVSGVGGLVGGVIVATRPERFPLATAPRLLAFAGGALGVVALALAVVPAPLVAFALFTGCIAVSMACFTVFSVVAVVYLQSETPRELVGKVMALVLSVSNCALPLGQLAYGACLDLLPVPVAALLAALASVALFVALTRVFKSEGVAGR